MVFAFLLQSAAAFDLRRLEQPAKCGERRAADEIVVCRSAEEKHRLRALDGERFEEGRLKAETDLAGGARAGVETEQANLNGFPSNRVKVKVKIPF